MTGAKWLLIIAVSYIGVVALIYFVQRAMMYFPERMRTAPAASVMAWQVAPRVDKPIVLHFHGNGGALCYRGARSRLPRRRRHRARGVFPG
jgi:hypothetical protein